MALKSKITKAEFDALSDGVKEHYKVAGDGYVLDTDEAADLRTALEKEREEKRVANEEAARLRAAAKKIEDDAAEAARLAAEETAKKSGDIVALETSWAAKVTAAEKKGADSVAELQTAFNDLLVDKVATDLAFEVSTAPHLLVPHIQKRLKAEVNGVKASTRVLDAAGQPTALTIEDLKKEIVADEKFAAIIKGSSASGGGANDKHSTASGGKKLSEMSEAERVKMSRENPAQFKEIVAANE